MRRWLHFPGAFAPGVQTANNWIGTQTTGNSVRSVAYGDGVFIAVAENAAFASGPQVYRSTDNGLSWAQHDSLALNTWYGTAFGNSTFISVSLTGTNRCMISTDTGLTWSAGGISNAHPWSAVAFGGGVFVAVSTDGYFTRSTDNGVTWSTPSAAVNANHWLAITYTQAGTFVAVADAGTNRCMVSSDGGVSFTNKSMPAGAWCSVAAGGGKLVAVEYGAASTSSIAVSTDEGQSWSYETSPHIAGWAGIAWGNGLFAAVAYTSVDPLRRIMTSTGDGTWTSQEEPNKAGWVGVAYGAFAFVGTATDSGTGDRFMYSNS